MVVTLADKHIRKWDSPRGRLSVFIKQTGLTSYVAFRDGGSSSSTPPVGDSSLLGEDGRPSQPRPHAVHYQRLYGETFIDLCERELPRMGTGGSLVGISSPGVGVVRSGPRYVRAPRQREVRDGVRDAAARVGGREAERQLQRYRPGAHRPGGVDEDRGGAGHAGRRVAQGGCGETSANESPGGAESYWGCCDFLVRREGEVCYGRLFTC